MGAATLIALGGGVFGGTVHAADISYQPKSGFGAVLNVAAGENMKILNNVAGSNSISFDVVKGFVQ